MFYFLRTSNCHTLFTEGKCWRPLRNFSHGSWLERDLFWGATRLRTHREAGPGCALRVPVALLTEIQCGINACVLVLAIYTDLSQGLGQQGPRK